MPNYEYRMTHLIEQAPMFNHASEPLPLMHMKCEEEIVRYKPEYAEVELQLHKKFNGAVEKNRDIDTVIMGTETYKQWVSARHFYAPKSLTPEFPTTYNGLKIVLVEGEGAEFVVSDVRKMLTVAFTNKLKMEAKKA